MRWILDSCTLIYLVKAKLFKRFNELIEFKMVIDTSVFEEVVINGKKEGYKDACEAENILKEFKIPIIPIDVSNDIELFRDAGETSCYILAKEQGICLTSDDRAYKKIRELEQNTVRLDTFFFQKCKEKNITPDEFIKILEKLESINATKPKSILFFMKKLNKMR